MQIEFILANGRIVRVTLPTGTVASSDQLAILMRWAVEGKPAEVMLD